MRLFVGEDHASVWAEQGGLSVKLPAKVVEGIADEATRRHPIGLSQPHWAKIAQEWVFRGHIDIEKQHDKTLFGAIQAAS
ncbi:hypothetical protein [Vreelandella massiliensis]|uniref:hypothetical protein n=1 Tax=Vreelandella massiliensis TaxID=1816686 RepID=UPI00118191C3|nr:hypothetical protein [Halomonas massiliensis]